MEPWKMVHGSHESSKNAEKKKGVLPRKKGRELSERESV